MANPQTNLRVRISADLGDIKQGLGLLRGELAKVKSEAARALPGAGSNAFVSGLRSARNELAAFAATYLSIRGAGVLAGIADEATQLRGRIKNAKGDYEAILAIANETRTGLAATADLYTRVERSTRGQIKNQIELLQLTKSVNQAIKLSYTGTAQGEAAVLQLGQALSSGRLGGDELRSISENAPRLAQAIANGLGVAQGALKNLGKEGKLTTEVVIGALKSQASALEAEYQKVPSTISDAFTQLRNSLVDYVGDQDAASGASRRFAETVREIAKDLPRYLDPVLQVLTLLLSNLDVLAVSMITRMAGAAIPAMITAFTAMRAAILAAAASTVTLRTALMLLGGPVGIVLAALTAALYLLWKRTNDAKVAAEEHTAAMNENKNLALASRDAALAEARAKRVQALATLEAARAILEEKKARAADTSSKFARGGDRGDGAAMSASFELDNARKVQAQAQKEFDDWGLRLVQLSLEISEEAVHASSKTSEAVATSAGDGKKAVKGMQDAAELASDAIKRQLGLLDQLLEDGKIKLVDFYAQKKALQLADIDGQIAAAQQEAKSATTSDAQSKALTNIVKLQRDRADLAGTIAREETKATEALTKQIGDVQIRLMELQGQTAAASRAKLEEEFLDLKRRLQAEGDLKAIAKIDIVIDIETAKAQIAQLQTQLQAITGKLGSKETSVSAQVGAGMMGGVEGEQQLGAARQAALEQMVALRNSTVDTLATMDPASPEAAAALSFLGELDGNIATVAGSMDGLRNSVKDAAINSVTNLFMDLVEGSKSAGEALRDFVRGFALAMAQIAARALATMLVLRLMDALWPGSAQLMVSAGNASSRVFHSGGIVGAGGRLRTFTDGLMASPFATGIMPRYHNGGIAGLGENEVPAILERGEEVLTRRDPRHRANGGLGGGGSNTIVKQPIVAIGDRAVADALAGSAGEDVVLTHVRNNWDALTRGAN